MVREAKASLNDKPKLLIVDDEVEIRENIGELLSPHFDPIYAGNGKEAVESAKKNLPDMILMDIMMPEMDGITACHALREDERTRHIPVIMLTAADSTKNRISSFGLGADDFLAKPFDVEELEARVLSKFKRSKELGRAIKQELHIANLTLILINQQVKVGDENIPFSPVEFDILKLLVQNEGVLVSRKQILETVWRDTSLSDRVMDAHIVAVRKKLKDFTGNLKTVYGTGYMVTA